MLNLTNCHPWSDLKSLIKLISNYITDIYDMYKEGHKIYLQPFLPRCKWLQIRDHFTPKIINQRDENLRCEYAICRKSKI